MNFLSIPPFSRAGIQTFSRHEQNQDLIALVISQISKPLVLYSEDLNLVWDFFSAVKKIPVLTHFILSLGLSNPKREKMEEIIVKGTQFFN